MLFYFRSKLLHLIIFVRCFEQHPQAKATPILQLTSHQRSSKTTKDVCTHRWDVNEGFSRRWEFPSFRFGALMIGLSSGGGTRYSPSPFDFFKTWCRLVTNWGKVPIQKADYTYRHPISLHTSHLVTYLQSCGCAILIPTDELTSSAVAREQQSTINWEHLILNWMCLALDR